MKTPFSTVYVLCAVLSTVYCEDDTYTTKYDNLDVDAIIKSPRLLKNYVNCVLDKGPCTPEGTELKKNIPDAIQSVCQKCSDKQKQLTNKVLQYLIDNEPEYWKILQEKYDPQGTYTKKYLDLKTAKES